MKFIKTELKDAYLIQLEQKNDERGYFARSFCRKSFLEQGLESNFDQCSISFNKKKNTLRGLHYQISPYEEIKLVRCIRGEIYDVIVDIRPDSPTYKKWIGVVLSESNLNALYVPKGFAHGFLTLQDDSEVFYHISSFYYPSHARTVPWNDPALSINWPIEGDLIISSKDENCMDFIK
jgi:dTDP-4-dehydrorhamnose 3,5-epimerase